MTGVVRLAPVSVLLLVPWLLVGSHAAADPDSEESPADLWTAHVRECTDGVTDLRADFTHQVIHPLGVKQEEMSGVVSLRRGGRLRLEYKSPKKKLIVSDGSILRAWDPGTKTLIETSPDREILPAAFGFVLDGKDAGAFLVRFVGGSEKPDGSGRAALELVPEKSSAMFEKVVLTLEPSCPSVKRVTIVDRMGTAVRITLDNVVTNPGIGHKRFQFEPPADAVVVKP